MTTLIFVTAKKIEVDPDLERGSKWIRIRPNVEDPGGSRFATLQKSTQALEKYDYENGLFESVFYCSIQKTFQSRIAMVSQLK